MPVCTGVYVPDNIYIHISYIYIYIYVCMYIYIYTCDLRRVHFFAFCRKPYFSAVSRKKRRLREKLPFHKMPVQRSGKVAVWTVTVAVWTGKIAVSIWQATACNAQLAKVSFCKKEVPSRWTTLVLTKQQKDVPAGKPQVYIYIYIFICTYIHIRTCHVRKYGQLDGWVAGWAGGCIETEFCRPWD